MGSSSVKLLCDLCGQEVPRHLWKNGAYHQVLGWERVAGTRASGKHGGSDIKYRERTGKVAHAGCLMERDAPQSEKLF